VTVLPMIWIAGFYEIEDLRKIKRCYFQPWFLFLLVISLLSLGGFPPMIGFIYKWVIFIGLFKRGSFIVCGYLIMMRIVSLFFYLRLCYLLYRVYWPEEKTSIVGGYITFPMKTRAVWGLIIIRRSLLFLSFFCIGPLGLF
jgi:formate hydrogenlyase subunit 3/multisubunit Na+/H+ antiporter MnhD subunit